MQKILSVGIDVGTSTTQVVFSELEMNNAGGFFTVPKISIVDKKVIYKSQVYFTPLKTDVLIDTEALEKIVAGEFEKAGFKPSDTQSGAVIITGESARKENADAVLASLSGYSGDFVVSAAGPDMESLIAGKGSGAYQYSIDHHCKVVNLDIGGGTTNVVVFDEGVPVARGCLDIGGRLIRVGRGGIVKKVSPAAAAIAEKVGVKIKPGDQVDVDGLRAITSCMARLLEAYLGIGQRIGQSHGQAGSGSKQAGSGSKQADFGAQKEVRGFMSERRSEGEYRFPDLMQRSDSAFSFLTDTGAVSSRDEIRGRTSLADSGRCLPDMAELLEKIRTPGSCDFELPAGIEAVFFSGGVADLIYHPQTDIRKYGDIGVLLGQAISQGSFKEAFYMPEPGETIRATVVGAGTYTTSISGSTITYSEDIFPLKNIPVIKLDEKLQDLVFQGQADQIIEHVRWYLTQNDASRFILAMPGKRDPGYMEMKRAAAAIGKIMDTTLAEGSPIILVIECDIAKAMGQMIRQIPQIRRQIVAIDSIHVEDGEYVDMGKPMMNGMVIPVVVKTLIFG